jgi:hypothetical protein
MRGRRGAFGWLQGRLLRVLAGSGERYVAMDDLMQRPNNHSLWREHRLSGALETLTDAPGR